VQIINSFATSEYQIMTGVKKTMHAMLSSTTLLGYLLLCSDHSTYAMCEPFMAEPDMAEPATTISTTYRN